jgi:large repetitive protein
MWYSHDWFRDVVRILVVSLFAQTLQDVRAFGRSVFESPVLASNSLKSHSGSPGRNDLHSITTAGNLTGLTGPAVRARSPLTASAPPLVAQAASASNSLTERTSRYSATTSRRRRLDVVTLSPAADPNDPYIVAQANALGNDPNAIFQFVRDQIGFEVYHGSLRGARGALWTKAGNALDRASLLIALLGSAGFQAQYVRGGLSLSLQQTLISKMFATPATFVGCPPSGSTRSDPLSDPQLNADASDHFWVEYGPSSVTLDPSFPGAQPGQVFGTVSSRFTTIPDALKHKTRIVLNVEMQLPLFQTSVTPVSDRTFATAEIFGKPLTLGFETTSTNQSSPIFTVISHNYTPFLRVQGNPADPLSDSILEGAPFQELFTNLQGLSSVVRALSVDITNSDSNGQQKTVTKYLSDKIGYAARTRQTGALVGPPADFSASISPADAYTLQIAAGKLANVAEADLKTAATALAARRAALLPQLQAVNFANPSPSDMLVLHQANTLAFDGNTLAGRLLATEFLILSDTATGMLANDMYVQPLWDSPRIAVASVRIAVNAGTAALQVSLDNLKDDLHVVLPPGQVPDVLLPFQISRGSLQPRVEQTVLGYARNTLPAGQITSFGASDIFDAARTQHAGALVVAASNLYVLDGTNFSADAKARIADSAAAGKIVIAPGTAPLVAGQPRAAWHEFDPVTLTYTDTDETGGHQDAFEYREIAIYGALAAGAMELAVGYFEGQEEALLSLTLAAAVDAINQTTGNQSRVHQVKDELTLEADNLNTAGIALGALGGIAAASGNPWLFVGGLISLDLAAGFLAAAAGIIHAKDQYASTHGDPAVPVYVGVNGQAQPAGTGPQLTSTVVPDPLYTLPVNGAQLPLVYRVQIANRSASADRFILTLNPTSGYSLQQSVSSVMVPAGSVGTIGVCLVPTVNPTPATATVSLTGQVASAANPSLTASTAFSSTVGPYGGLQLSVTPSFAYMIPGQTTSVQLQAQWFGTNPSTAEIQIQSVPGIAVGSVQSPVSLSPNGISTQPLSFTVAPSVAPGAVFDIPFQAGSPTVASTPVPSTASFRIAVVTPESLSAFGDVTAAAQTGRVDMSSMLNGIGTYLIKFQTDPSNTAFQAGLLGALDALIATLTAPQYASVQSQLAAARAAIAGHAQGAAALLSAALQSLNIVLQSPAAYPFDFELIPNSATSQPNLPATFKIGLFNKALVPVTYTLALSGVPAGVTGGLNSTTVTVPAGQSIPVGNANDAAVILTQPADLSTFSFNVTASANGVAGSTKTASGTLTARSQFLNVQQVVATPAFISPGGTTAVTASLANVVNQTRNVNVALTVLNSTNAVVLSPPPQSLTLSIVSLVTPVNFGTIATQSLPAGNYTLLVTVTDPATNQTLPGGIGSGALLIGSPVTATLAVNPLFVPTGNSLVTSTLTVNTSGASRANPLILLGSVATPSPAESLALNGNLAYLCDDNEVSVVNVSDPTHPILLNTAVADSIKNDGIIHCAIQRGTLVVFADASNSTIGNNPSFVAFDLTNPTQPQLIKGTAVNKRFFDEPSYVGNFAFVPTVAITFFFGSQDDKFGDLVAVDISDFTNPVVVGTLEPPVDAALGGHGNIWGGTLLNNTTMILGGSFSTGGGNSGPGRFQVADITNPANMQLLADLPVPGTVEVYTPLFQGNTAVAIADNAGWQGGFPSFRNGDPLVIVTFDITNPALPAILATVAPANLQLGLGGGQARIGDKLFLFGQVQDTTGQQLLLLVDTTDPHNPALRTFPIGTPVTRMVASGNVLHTTSGAAGYAAYSIPGVGGGGQFTAQVQVPKGTGVNYDPASFNIAPSSITLGTGFDTLVWTNPANNVLTWNSNVLNSQPGQVRPVALSGLVNFTSTLGNGSVTLPQTSVLVEQILGLSPPSQSFQAGQPSLYTVTVKNPTSAPLVYNLSVTGIVPNWVSLASSVTVPAGGQVNVPLTIQTEATAAPANYTFIVTASTPGGTQGSVQGAFGLTGAGSPNPGSVGSSTALGVSLTLTPTQATAGQGTTATFAVQVANAGNVADTYTLSATVPPGVTAVFNHPSLTIQPGLSNAQQVSLSLTVAQGTAAAAALIPVRAVSSTKNTVSDQKTATLNISGNGVRVALSPATALQGGTFQMTVTNLGNVSDTFDLSLGGPAAVIATLASPSATLAPNASQTVSIAVGPAPFATLGSLPIVAIATSRANTAVTANASASVTIPATLGVTAVFNPQSQRLNALGSAVFPLNVQNTGTVEDAYSATIVSTSGPITASLVGLDGNPTQSIARFRLPGVSGGQLVLNATLTGSAADGVVTVKIQSLTNPAISATASAVLGLNKPFARAGRGQNVLKNAFTFLDGSQSFDGGGAKLTYRWTLVSQPGNSHISTSDIQGSTGPRPWVAPDKEGTFVFQLITNNGLKDSDPVTQTLNVFNNHVPPTADAGKPLNAKRGVAVTVDGSASANSPLNHPPKSNPLTYQWAFSQVPAGSHLTNASLTGATQAKATFIPDVNGAYVLTLTVNDGDNTSSDSVTVTASDSNVPPNAVAGKDRRTLPSFVVNLDGSASNDPDNGPQPLSFTWNFVFGALNNSAIVNPASSKPSFTPAATGFYVTRMVISDGASFSGDNVTVTVANACDANADGVVDGTDQDLMAAFIGQPALPNDPLDADHDGMITQNDIDLCAKSGKKGTTPAPDSAAGAGSVITAPGAATASGRAESGRVRARISAVLNGASLRAGAVSPGEVVVITGSGFGPSAAFTFERGATGRAPVSLAGVEVRFDGRPAPVLQVAPDQISTVVPYAVAGQPWTSIEVVSGDGRSEAVRISVADAAPGVFTSPAPQSSDGDAADLPAIATNEDGNANSDLTPAAAGSIITVFLTGAGETIPPGVEGALVETGELRPRLPLRAFFDGQPAEIVGTAPAPGIVSSVIGLRVRIPAGLAPGLKRITIQVGNASSQPGVTVAVR